MADINVVVRRTVGSATFADVQAGATISRILDPAQSVVHPKADTVTIIVGVTGQVAFFASVDHAVVTSYLAQLRVAGSVNVVDSQNLFKPTPDGNNVIVVDLSVTGALFDRNSAGNYTLSILTFGPGGLFSDSIPSAPFSLPIA